MHGMKAGGVVSSVTCLQFSFAFFGDFERYRDLSTTVRVQSWGGKKLVCQHQ